MFYLKNNYLKIKNIEKKPSIKNWKHLNIHIMLDKLNDYYFINNVKYNLKIKKYLFNLIYISRKNCDKKKIVYKIKKYFLLDNINRYENNKITNHLIQSIIIPKSNKVTNYIKRSKFKFITNNKIEFLKKNLHSNHFNRLLYFNKGSIKKINHKMSIVTANYNKKLKQLFFNKKKIEITKERKYFKRKFILFKLNQNLLNKLTNNKTNYIELNYKKIKDTIKFYIKKKEQTFKKKLINILNNKHQEINYRIKKITSISNVLKSMNINQFLIYKIPNFFINFLYKYR